MEYTENEKYYIWLHCQYVISNKKINALLAFFATPKKVFEAFESKNLDILQFIKKEEYDKILKYASQSFVEAFLNKLQRDRIFVICKFSSFFPSKLANLAFVSDIDILYCKGDKSLFEQKSIAIVGTRKPDSYGKEVTEVFTKALSDAGLVIISGLATGVDTIAHKTTLDCNGKTIAVINGGFNHIYPTFNTNLSKLIEEKGLIVTEQPPQVQPSKFGFPIRNRIIAALSDGVFIPQMGDKSGAIHTFNYAIEYGKNAFLAPADIFRATSSGNLALLTEYCGSIVCSASQILKDLGVDYVKASKEKAYSHLSKDEKIILESIGDDEYQFDELVNKTGLSAKILNSLLTTMNISGIINCNTGNYYSKNHTK